MTDSGTQENTMKLGGGTANGMRALGYQVLPPNTDSTCWRMITPQGPHTEHLAADEAEGWCKAEQHWQASSVYNALRRTPAPVSGDMREVIKRAVLPIIDKVPAVDASQSRIREIRAGWMADAALTALAPHIAAEIAAAREEGRRNERAEVVAYGNPTQFSTWGNQVARFIEAVKRGEHTKGEK